MNRMKKFIDKKIFCILVVFVFLGCSACGASSSASSDGSSYSEVAESGISERDESCQSDSKKNESAELKEYVIYYDLGMLVKDPYMTFGAESKTVSENSEFILDEPSCYGYVFQGWKIVDSDIYCKNGVYEWNSDIYLIAEWEKDDNSSRWWTSFY